MRLGVNTLLESNICAVWQSYSDTKSEAVVIADGCRDLILKVSDKKRPKWFVSPMFDQATPVSTAQNTYLMGFRMKPGVHISEAALLHAVNQKMTVVDDIENLLADFTSFDHNVDDALSCLADGAISVKQAAIQLGVNIRTLQRLVVKATDRTPAYWSQLARIRKTARDLDGYIALAELADKHGFSDQAHMSREFKRWFNLSPSEVLKRPDIISQIHEVGYA